MRNRRCVHAFTLLELLVIMSILTLLAAIVQSSSTQARRAGMRSSCESNLRQIGAAISLYGIDNDDEFPSAVDQYWMDHPEWWVNPTKTPVASLPNIIDVLAPYTHSGKIFYCPGDTLGVTRIIGETVAGDYPSWFAYDRSSYFLYAPQFFGKSQTKYASASFPLARDYDPRWHCAYENPQLPTPAYNFLYADTHVKFQSLLEGLRNMREAQNSAQ